MRALLSPSDTQRIEALIKDIEARSAGELVVLVAQRSSDYLAPRVLCAALLSVGLSYVGYRFLGLPAEYGFAAQPVLAAFLVWLLGLPPLLRLLLPTALIAEEVDARAKLCFIERGVTETRDRSGVLIYLSELEHRVAILADSGVHARLGDSEWQRDVEEVVASIRKGQAAEGICQVLSHLGDELEKAFPRRADDDNELDDRVERV